MFESSYKTPSNFLDLFYEPEIDKHAISKKTKVSLYILRIDGGKFDYGALYSEVGNASMAYVLSRKAFKEAVENAESNMHESVNYVRTRFREAKINKGEGGEVILYCFLESHLGAPKILSKMELKTAGNDYIKGADGIHLLDLGDDSYQLIFGESKLISDAKDDKLSSLRIGIYDAFESIKKVEKQGTTAEIKLIDSNLMKESFDEELLSKIKSVLLPSARGSGPKKENAFGIFVGFEIDIADWDKANMSTEEFEEKIKFTVKTTVEARYEYIQKRIEHHNLTGYHFYIYVIPFIKDKETNIDVMRRDMIEVVR